MKTTTKNTHPSRINIITLGCSKNTCDSEALAGQLSGQGLSVAHEGPGEIVVINTCGFIGDAKEQSIDVILEQAERKRRGEIQRLYVTGCLVQRYQEELAAELPEVDGFYNLSQLRELLSALGADYRTSLVGERLLSTPSHYAYLKISEGCDRSCSYCAIPMIRGRHISVPMEDLVAQTEKLAQGGVKELILIAQDLTYYGIDLYGKRCLAELIRRLARIDGICWIRLH